MARIFTTSFEFNNQQYDAIVTVIANQDQVTFKIRLLDVDLHQFFPSGEVSYHGSDGFKSVEALDNTIAQSIMRKIENAIKKHLVTT